MDLSDDTGCPIEDAPKDRTRILVWCEMFEPPMWRIARWNDDRHAQRPKPYWEREGVGYVTDMRRCPPSRWMPLPPPPQEKA